MNATRLGLTVFAIVGVFPAAPAQAWPYVGEVVTFPYSFRPAGWERLDGRVIPIFGHEALFKRTGASQGGDGLQNFKLPNVPVDGALAGDGLYGVRCVAVSGLPIP